MASAPTRDVRVEVSRDLGLGDVTGLGIGAMVGAGIFVLLAPATQAAGLSMLPALGLSGLVVLLSAAAYAELASVFPKAGGGYEWAKEGLPPPSGFLTGWIAWAGHSAALALSATSLSAFTLFGIGAVFDRLGTLGITSFLSNATYGTALKVVALLIILGFVSTTTFRSRSRVRKLPRPLVLKIALIIAFLVAVLFLQILSPPSGAAPGLDFPGPNGLAGIPLGIAFVFVAFEGYEIIALSANEVKQPRRTIPKGILVSVGLVVILYVMLEISLIALARYNCTTNLAICVAAGSRVEVSFPELALDNMGILGAGLLTVAGLVAMFTAVSNNMSSAARLSYAMAKDGTLPERLADTSNGGRLPNGAVLASGGLAIVFALALDIPQLAMVASILYMLLFAFVNMALVSLRKRGKEHVQGFRVPLVPLVPVTGTVANMLLAISLFFFPAVGSETIPPGRIAWSLVLLWLTVGLFYHFFAGGKELVSRPEDRRRTDLSEIFAIGKEEIDLQRYRVFLPLREMSDVSLVKFGAEIAKARGGELSLLNVVEIPRNLPPRAIRFSYVNDRIRDLEKLSRMTKREGVDTRASVKIGHKVYEIIIDTLSEEDVNLLVLGWRGGREAPGRILGSNIDYLVETAPCDVVVLKTKGLMEKPRRALLVCGSSFSLEGLSDIALILSKNAGAEIKVLVIVGHELEIARETNAIQSFLEKCKAADIPTVQKAVVAGDVEETVKRESVDCDVVLISALRQKGARRLTLSPTEQRLARALDKPVLLFRKGIRGDLAF